GEVVARAKVIPLVVPAARVCEAERIAASTGVLSVRPFLPMRVGAVVQESLGGSALGRFEANLSEKLSWLGSELLPPLQVAPAEEAPAGAVEGLLGEGAGVILVAGVRAM